MKMYCMLNTEYRSYTLRSDIIQRIESIPRIGVIIMTRNRTKTFKGIKADVKLTDFINTYNVKTYLVTSYTGKVGTPERKVVISYLNEDVYRPNGNE